MPMTAQVLNLKVGDDIALQYLGAAVVLQWHSLPKQSLMQQATSVGGLPLVGSLRDQIKRLLRRDRD